MARPTPVTRGLREYVGRKKSVSKVKVYLVTTDGEGKAVPADAVHYEGCSLRTFA